MAGLPLHHFEKIDGLSVVDAVRPFVGARLRGDLSQCIDIVHGRGTAARADVRRMNDDGVFVHFYGRDELIPWSDLYEITVSALDEHGTRLNRITFERDRHLKHAIEWNSTRRAA